MNINEGFTPAPHIKVAINVGACFDIPTGTYIQGRRGEWILNGGLSCIEGLTGIPNAFKSKLAEYKMYRAMGRMGVKCGTNTYDSETNKQENHIVDVVLDMPEYFGTNPFLFGENGEPPRCIITDKGDYTGDEWYALFRAMMENKRKNANKLLVETPFWNRNQDGPFKIIRPNGSLIDSLSAFETKDVIDIQNEHELGDSGANPMHMRQGLAKQRLLMETPRICNGVMNFLTMTAHQGMETGMQKGAGGRDQPVKKLAYMKDGQAMKQVTGYFLSITQNLYQVKSMTPLVASDGNGPEFPRDGSDRAKYDTDLNKLTIINLRGKSGVSGMPIVVLVSQSEGVQDSLAEFYNIKENGRFGLEGNNTTYQLALVPGVNIMRTTIRNKIKEDAKIRRALNIQSEMLQIKQYWHGYDDLVCTPKELYDDLKAKGYDWDILLNTRGWWTLIENEPNHPPFLSTWDLLLMRKGEYHPFWLKDDKKTIVPKWWEL